MAMLFLLEQRLLYKRDIPLLSCFDIMCILSFLLPQRAFDTDEVFRQMEIRHKRRQVAIDSAYRKQLREYFQNWLKVSDKVELKRQIITNEEIIHGNNE
jgi:hypothetical protein